MQWLDPHKKLIVPLFFGLFLLTGFWLAPDFGISWDEAIQRDHGIVSVDYVLERLGLTTEKYLPQHSLQTYEHRHYSVLFSMSCFGLERLLGLEDFRGKHLLRHYAVFFLFWLATIAFYHWVKERFGDWKWGLLGVLFLVLSPRIFGHAFYNVKDSVFLSAYLLSGYTLWRFLKTRTYRAALWHALATALLLNVRITGIFIPALTAGWLVLDFLFLSGKGAFLRQMAPRVVVYVLVTFGLTTLFWPYLWEAPIDHFFEAIAVMGQYNWQGEALLWGHVYKPHEEHIWFYVPSWMLVTVPVLHTLFFLAGLVGLGGRTVGARDFWKFHWYRQEALRFDWMAFSLYLLPLLAVVVKGSTLYDGWRQMQFIYPPFVMIALAGLWWLLRQAQTSGKPQRKQAIKVVVAAGLLAVVAQMISIHPHHYAYFNFLAGTNRHLRFEQDYWGLSYKQAFERLLETDSSAVIKYDALNYPGNANREFLPVHQANRLEQVWSAKEQGPPTYYLTNFRSSWERGRYRKQKPPFNQEVFTIKVGKTPILGVFRNQIDPPPVDSTNLHSN